MTAASTVGILLIPMLYVVFQGMREWAHGRFGRDPRRPGRIPRLGPRRKSHREVVRPMMEDAP